MEMEDVIAEVPNTWCSYATTIIEWCINHGAFNIEVQPCITLNYEHHFMLLTDTSLCNTFPHEDLIARVTAIDSSLVIDDFLLVTEEFEFYSCDVDHHTNAMIGTPRPYKPFTTKFAPPKSLENKPTDVRIRIEKFLKGQSVSFKPQQYMLIVIKMRHALTNDARNTLAQRLYDTFVLRMIPTPLSPLPPLHLHVHNLSSNIPYQQWHRHVKKVELNASLTLILRRVPKEADPKHVYFAGQPHVLLDTTLVVNDASRAIILRLCQSSWLISDVDSTCIQTFVVTHTPDRIRPDDIMSALGNVSDAVNEWAMTLMSKEGSTSSPSIDLTVSDTASSVVRDDDKDTTAGEVKADDIEVEEEVAINLAYQEPSVLSSHGRLCSDTTVTTEDEPNADHASDYEYTRNVPHPRAPRRSLGCKRRAESCFTMLSKLCRAETTCQIKTKILQKGGMPADWIITLFDSPQSWKASYTEFYACIYIITYDALDTPLLSDSDVTAHFADLNTDTACAQPRWLAYKVITDVANKQAVEFYRVKEWDVDQLNIRITVTVQHPVYTSNKVWLLPLFF